LRLLDERSQCLALRQVSRTLQKVAEATHRGVFIVGCDRRQHVRSGLPAEILGDLREAVDARGLMEVARTVEQRQLEARDFGKARLTLERAEPVGPVDLTECSGTLIDELQLLPADREIP